MKVSYQLIWLSKYVSPYILNQSINKLFYQFKQAAPTSVTALETFCDILNPHYSQTSGYIVNDEYSIEIMSWTESDGDIGINGGDESECESANEDGGGIDHLSSTFRLEIEGDVDTNANKHTFFLYNQSHYLQRWQLRLPGL